RRHRTSASIRPGNQRLTAEQVCAGRVTNSPHLGRCLRSRERDASGPVQGYCRQRTSADVILLKQSARRRGGNFWHEPLQGSAIPTPDGRLTVVVIAGSNQLRLRQNL